MSNITYLQSQLDRAYRDDYSRRFPGFEKPRIVPGTTIRSALGVTYLARYIDQDPDSWYMFIKGDVTKGDASRENVCRLVQDFFYDKMGMPSSFDVDAGGEYSREQAIDKEVLPARADSAYRTYYQEQMDALDAMQHEQNSDTETPDTSDDDDVIDIVERPDGTFGPKDDSANERSVGAATSTAVAMPKPIIFAVCFHIPASGARLGMGGAGDLGHSGSGRRGIGRGRGGYLREEDLDDMMKEAEEASKELKESNYARGWLDCGARVMGVVAILRENGTPDAVAYADELEAATVKAFNKDGVEMVPELQKMAAEHAAKHMQECDRCGDDECVDGEKCGMKEDEEVEENDILLGRKHNGHIDEEDDSDTETLDESLVAYTNFFTREIS